MGDRLHRHGGEGAGLRRHGGRCRVAARPLSACAALLLALALTPPGPAQGQTVQGQTAASPAAAPTATPTAQDQNQSPPQGDQTAPAKRAKRKAAPPPVAATPAPQEAPPAPAPPPHPAYETLDEQNQRLRVTPQGLPEVVVTPNYAPSFEERREYHDAQYNQMKDRYKAKTYTPSRGDQLLGQPETMNTGTVLPTNPLLETRGAIPYEFAIPMDDPTKILKAQPDAQDQGATNAPSLPAVPKSK